MFLANNSACFTKKTQDALLVLPGLFLFYNTRSLSKNIEPNEAQLKLMALSNISLLIGIGSC